jgi:DNA repair exonuclease SbcCD ATPase subunit
MKLNKIRWQNLLSYGNYWTEVDFLKDDLTVIVGINGSGKSTLLDALCFVLFGKAFRNINKPLLVNSITKKELLVEVELTIGVIEYRIIRGIKPAKFEIWTSPLGLPQGFVKQDMTGVRDEQAALETILGCNFKSFTQVVCLGADYTPFLKLDKADRRKVVENLLNLEIFSTMNVMLKEDYAVLMDRLKVLETQRTILREKHAAWQEALGASEDLRQSRIEALEEEIAGFDSERLFQEEEMAQLEILSDEEIAPIVLKVKEYEECYEMWKKRDYQCDQLLKQVGNEVKFYEEHKTCPTCQQNIDPEFVQKMWEDKNYHLARYRDAKVKIKGEMELAHELWAVQDSLNNKQKNNLLKRNQYLFKISTLEVNIERALKKIEAEKQEHEVVKQEVIDELVKDLEIVEQTFRDEHDNKADWAEIGKMLKDDGIKAVAISNYMTFINESINKFLTEMDLFVSLYLDGEFNETVKSRYRDEFRYDSFSEGQKMRIDLAILFTWREIAKQRNSLSVNLLIFDEVLSGSLDAEGIVDLIKILEGRFKENIFLITHDDRITSRFANIISVTQEGGFSRMERRGQDDK